MSTVKGSEKPVEDHFHCDNHARAGSATAAARRVRLRSTLEKQHRHAAEQSARQQAATRRPQGGADRRPAALQGWGGEVIAVAGYVGDASGAV